MLWSSLSCPLLSPETFSCHPSEPSLQRASLTSFFAWLARAPLPLTPEVVCIHSVSLLALPIHAPTLREGTSLLADRTSLEQFRCGSSVCSVPTSSVLHSLRRVKFSGVSSAWVPCQPCLGDLEQLLAAGPSEHLNLLYRVCETEFQPRLLS